MSTTHSIDLHTAAARQLSGMTLGSTGSWNGRSVHVQNQGFGNLEEPRHAGLTSLKAARTIAKSFSDAQEAHKLGDRETCAFFATNTVQKVIQVIGGSASIVSKVMLSGSFLQAFKVHATVMRTFACSVAGVGLVLCAIEGALESYRLYSMVKFQAKLKPGKSEDTLKELLDSIRVITTEENNQINQEIAQLPKDKQQAEKAKLIQNAQQKKINKLKRLIAPELAERLLKEAPALLAVLKSSDNPETRAKALQKADKLLSDIQTHVTKKIWTHIVGLAVTALICFSLCLTFTTLAPAIPITIAIIVASLARNWMYLGWVNSDGWEFKPENCGYSLTIPLAIAHAAMNPKETADKALTALANMLPGTAEESEELIELMKPQEA